VKNSQIQKLKEKVFETSRLAGQRYSALKEKELELDRLVKRFEEAEKSNASRQNAVKPPGPLSIEERKTASDLHRQIDNLKAEINLQQHDRRQLRKELREAQKKYPGGKPAKHRTRERMNKAPNLKPGFVTVPCEESVPVLYEGWQ
jgi:hypothetical protein